MTEPTLLLDDLCFAEGPRWHRGRLYFADMHAREVVAVTLDGKRETLAQVPNRPSGLGFGRDGRLRIVSMLDRKLLQLNAAGELTELANLHALAGGHCNDLVIDAHDRCYLGNFGFDFEGGGQPAATCLIRVDPDGRATVVAQDLMFPNGLAITPDGQTLVVAETFARKLTAFQIAPNGDLSDRRVFAQVPAFPDGICLDAEGCVWLANPVKPGGFLRVAEGGEIRQRIDLDDRIGVACMLGGPDRRTLFLLEAFAITTDAKRGNARIRTLRVDVPGAGWPSAEA